MTKRPGIEFDYITGYPSPENAVFARDRMETMACFAAGKPADLDVSLKSVFQNGKGETPWN